MKIKLSPIASNKTTQVSVSGLVVTVDDTPYDLSVIPEGGQAESDNEHLIGTVTREEVTVRYHYDSKLAEPNQSTNPLDYEFDMTVDGVVTCPIKWRSK